MSPKGISPVWGQADVGPFGQITLLDVDDAHSIFWGTSAFTGGYCMKMPLCSPQKTFLSSGGSSFSGGHVVVTTTHHPFTVTPPMAWTTRMVAGKVPDAAVNGKRVAVDTTCPQK